MGGFFIAPLRGGKSLDRTTKEGCGWSHYTIEGFSLEPQEVKHQVETNATISATCSISISRISVCEQCVVSVCLYSPGSQQGGVSPS